MELKEVYKQLTNIDIDEQRQIWDDRGKGYYGEYLVFCDLYRLITGNSKILMNLNIPIDNSNTTELDLLLIHETGLYVFEVKHYKGTIYGKDTDSIWTQYFKTASNNIFKNPIEQNGYHIRALKRLFPDIPIRSVIVFTNNDCDIKVINSNSEIDICSLKNINSTLSNRFQKCNNKLSMQKIDDLFNQLSIYSPMKETVVIDKDEASFFSWIQPVIAKLEETKTELEQEKKQWISNTEKSQKAKKRGIYANIAIAIVCIIVSAVIVIGFQKGYDSAIQKNNNELAIFKQNFLHIDQIGNEYIDELNSYINVSNVSLLPLSDDAVSFTARIAMANDTYGIALTENSKYIVMTNSGKVFEYDVFGEHLPYNRISNMIGKGLLSYGDLAEIQFYGISDTNEITYIKITNIELFKLDMRRTVIKDELEIELYSK